MIQRSKNLIRIAIAIFIILPVLMFGYYVNAGFDESRYFSRYSVDYYLLIDSALVKEFPVPDNPLDVIYHYSCGDGPKPPSTAVQIKADTDTVNDDYLKKIEIFMTVKQLEKTSQQGIFDTSTVYLTEQGEFVELVMTKEEANVYSIILEHSY